MKRPPRNDLGHALRVARTAASLSQEAFSDVSGRTYISQLERGERHATLSKIDELAAVLGIHPASLVAFSYLHPRASRESVEGLMATLREELMGLVGTS